MGVSNHLIGILNFATALLSIPTIGAGLWLATKSHATDCMKFLQWPLIILGLFLLTVSLTGLFGAYCRIPFLLWIYAFFMLLLIITLFCFTVFSLVVTNKGAGDAVSGKGFHEFHLGNYSSWLQRQVDTPSVWNKIKSCIADSDTCQRLSEEYTTLDSFSRGGDVSPIQSGCCKPPSSCGYAFVNATTWTSLTLTGSHDADFDCGVWNNDQSKLCFDCASCKAGVLQTAKKDWHSLAIVNAVALGFLVVVYSLSCCALRSSSRDQKSLARYVFV